MQSFERKSFCFPFSSFENSDCRKTERSKETAGTALGMQTSRAREQCPDDERLREDVGYGTEKRRPQHCGECAREHAGCHRRRREQVIAQKAVIFILKRPQRLYDAKATLWKLALLQNADPVRFLCLTSVFCFRAMIRQVNVEGEKFKTIKLGVDQIRGACPMNISSTSLLVVTRQHKVSFPGLCFITPHPASDIRTVRSHPRHSNRLISQHCIIRTKLQKSFIFTTQKMCRIKRNWLNKKQIRLKRGPLYFLNI